MRVPGQRRLAISRLRVPYLDGFVIAAAGNLLSIGAPRHRIDTFFFVYCEKSVDESTDVVRGKTSKNLPSRVPPHRALANVYIEIHYISIFFEHLFLKKSHVFE